MNGHSLSHTPTTRKSYDAAIDGNICRCTGYKSLDAPPPDSQRNGKIGRPENALAWLSEKRLYRPILRKYRRETGGLGLRAAAETEPPDSAGPQQYGLRFNLITALRTRACAKKPER
jgi:hypothetical protein